MRVQRWTAILSAAVLIPLVPALFLNPSIAQVTTGQNAGQNVGPTGNTGNTSAFPSGPQTGTPAPGIGTQAAPTTSPASASPGTTTNAPVTPFGVTNVTPTTTPVSPLAPSGTEVAPNGNVQVQTGVGTPGATTTPVSPLSPSGTEAAPNGNVQIQTGSPAGSSGTPVSPLAPNGAQVSPNGNVQIQTGNQSGNRTGTAPNGAIGGGTTGTTGNSAAPGVNGTVPGRTSPIQTQIIPLGGGTVVTPRTTPQTQVPRTRSNQLGTPLGTRTAPASSAIVPTQNFSQALSIQSTPGTLDAQLQQATCSQNWGQAIQLVDRALSAPLAARQPGYRSQLLSYRNRLQSLRASGAQIPNWQQQCR